MPEDAVPELRIDGLNYEDVADLNDILNDSPTPDVRFQENALRSSKLGEPLTFLLIASLSSAGIGVLGAFLMKKRRTTNVRFVSKTTYPDGTERLETLELAKSESGPPPPEVIDKLASITKLSSEQIKGLLTQ